MALFDRLFGERYTAARARQRRRSRVIVSSTAHRAAELLRSTNALIQLSEAEALTVVYPAEAPAPITRNTPLLTDGLSMSPNKTR